MSPAFDSRSSAVIKPEDGSDYLPHDQVAAIAKYSQFQADVTAIAVQRMGFDLRDFRGMEEFLLELGAVAQLYIWESRGLALHLKSDLPTAKEASKELAEQTRHFEVDSLESKRVPLWSRVLRVWTEQFAWCGQDLLQADVVVGDVDEEEFVDVLAEFLWKHRHQLRGCLSQEEESE